MLGARGLKGIRRAERQRPLTEGGRPRTSPEACKGAHPICPPSGSRRGEPQTKRAREKLWRTLIGRPDNELKVQPVNLRIIDCASDPIWIRAVSDRQGADYC
eukprot:8924076-Pyramimonas_sp.AAC.1